MTSAAADAVRRAVPADRVAIEQLVRAAYQHYIERIGVPPAPMSADYGQLIADGAVWVSEADEGIAGVLVVDLRTDHLLIDNVAVAPALQGGGVGTLLLGFAERLAVEHRLGEVRLYTNEKMTENLAYYPRRGYVESGRGIEHGFTRVYFRKRL